MHPPPVRRARSISLVEIETSPKRGAAALGFVGGVYTGGFLWQELVANELVKPAPLSSWLTPSFQLPDASSLQLPDTSSLKLPDVSSLQLPDPSSLKLPDVSSLQLPDTSSLKLPDVSALKLPDVSSALGELGDSLKEGASKMGEAVPDVNTLTSSLDEFVPPAWAAEVPDGTAFALGAASFDGLPLDGNDASALTDGISAAAAALVRTASGLAAQLTPASEVAAAGEAQLQAAAAFAIEYVGSLTGETLVPLAAGVLGAAALAGLSDREDALGGALRLAGSAVDLLLQLVFGVATGALRASSGALVGALVGALIGPRTVISLAIESAKAKTQATQADDEADSSPQESSSAADIEAPTKSVPSPEL